MIEYSIICQFNKKKKTHNNEWKFVPNAIRFAIAINTSIVKENVFKRVFMVIYVSVQCTHDIHDNFSRITNFIVIYGSFQRRKTFNNVKECFFFKRRKMKNDSYENMVYVDDFVCDALWAKKREKKIKNIKMEKILIHFTLETFI